MDIVVVRGPGDAVTLDVKAVAGKNDWLAGTPEANARKRHYVALMSYEGTFSDQTKNPVTWILPHGVYLAQVKASAPPSKMKYISRKAILALSQYKDAWSLIVQADNAS